MMVIKLNQRGLSGFFIVFIILSILTISGMFIATNLPNSLPGDMIYPIKGIYENLNLAINELSYESRAEVFADLSKNRLDEFEKLVNRKDFSRIPQTLDKMILMQKKSLDNIEQAQNRGINVTAKLFKLDETFQKQQSSLKKLYFEVSPETYLILDKAVESIQESLNRIEVMKTRR